MQRGRGGAIGGANSQTGRFVDQFPDLEKVEEYGRIDRSWARRAVIAQGESLEDFGGQAKPRAMVG